MDKETELQDLQVVDRFNQEFKQLCLKHGLLVQVSTSGVARVYVLVGSSKSALSSNIYPVYSGRM